MTKPTVLFVCVHNAGCSQMAAGFLQALAGAVSNLLLTELIDSTEEAGSWTIQASIFPGSLRLHERHGFLPVSTRLRIAKAVTGPYAGTWRDTVLIERRSVRTHPLRS